MAINIDQIADLSPDDPNRRAAAKLISSMIAAGRPKEFYVFSTPPEEGKMAVGSVTVSLGNAAERDLTIGAQIMIMINIIARLAEKKRVLKSDIDHAQACAAEMIESLGGWAAVQAYIDANRPGVKAN